MCSKFERKDEEVPQISPKIQTSSIVQQAIELLIKHFLKEGLNLQFHLSLRDFTYNSIILHVFYQVSHLYTIAKFDITMAFLIHKLLNYWICEIWDWIVNFLRSSVPLHIVHCNFYPSNHMIYGCLVYHVQFTAHYFTSLERMLPLE